LLNAIPLGFNMLGMILISIGLAFDQPPSPPEKDPVKTLTGAREAFRNFSIARGAAMKRQKRVGQYAWLLLVAAIGSFILLYVDAVGKTTLSNQIASLQTLWIARSS
jgi:hypothetical protein